MNLDLNSLLSMPRQNRVAMSSVNSTEGLYFLIKQFFKPDFTMVEVGSLEGVSTLLFAKFCKKVYSVDYYSYVTPPTGRIPEHDAMFVEAEKLFIERTKDIPNIVKIRKTSMEAVKDFEDESLDAVYIDAAHEEEFVREDIREWRKKLKPGGLLCGHDFWLPYIGKILREEEGFYDITISPDTSWCVPVPTIDLVSVACTKVPETIEAMRKCQAQKKFTRSILFTNEEIQVEGIEVIKISQLDYTGYNRFVSMELWKYIGSDYILLMQNDSWILNGKKWDDKWYKYDYIGAGWPIPPEEDNINYRTPTGELVRVGNGGFSLRSRTLLRAPTLLGFNFDEPWAGFPTEDGWLCVYHRDELMQAGAKFAPVEEAVKFSRELPIPELKDNDTFGFHRYEHIK